MADSDSRGSEKPEGSESGLEELKALFVKMAQKMIQEMKQDIRAVVVQLDRSIEAFGEELVAARRRCEGSTEVVRSRVEEVVAAQSPVSDQQLCGMTGHCELRVSVADMEKPCLLGLTPCLGMQRVMTSEGCSGRYVEKSYHWSLRMLLNRSRAP